MNKDKFPLMGWLTVLTPFALGIIIRFGMPSYSFSSYICYGIGAVGILYRLLDILAKRELTTAKLLRMLLSCLLCFGILGALITGIVIFYGGQQEDHPPCDYIIVLGAGVNGSVPSLTLWERIDAAYDYLMANPNAVCVVSGGQGGGEDISEAQCMFNELTKKGIRPERIWMEDKSTSTKENLSFTLALIEAKTGIRPSHLGIVSNEYHLFRAGLMAQDQGLTCTRIPAHTSWLSLRINYHLREIVAVWYYLIVRLFL